MNNIKEALLILGHGSRDPVSVQEFVNFTDDFQSRNGLKPKDIKLENAFLELSEPSIPQALNNLVQAGVRKITAIPYFLFRAGHVKMEIPEMLEEFKASNPEIEILYGSSLWPHPNLTELAVRRINHALESFSEESRKNVEVLVVGRGATDPEAIQQFIEAVEALKNRIVCKNLSHCFIALAEPKYTQALPEILGNGTKNVVIFPYYLFTGILVKRIESMAQQAQQLFRDAQIKITPHFGADPLMFDMLNERILQTVKN